MRAPQLALALVTAGLTAIGVWAQESKLKYPETKKGDVVDDYHGTKVADPYRWLEDDVRKSKDVADWVEAQNKVTFGYLEVDPRARGDQEAAHRAVELREVSPPRSRTAAATSSRKNDGLQNQNVLYVQDTLDGEPRVLLDPNTLAQGRHRRAGRPGGQRRRQATSPTASPRPGRDWNTWKVRDVDTGKPLDDELKWVKFSGASWTKDGKGFFYSRFPEPKKGDAFQGLNVNQKLYYHKLGTPQSEDVLVYERPDQPKWGVGGERHRRRPLPRHHRQRRHHQPQGPHRLQGPRRRRTRKPVDLDRQLRQRVQLPRQRRRRSSTSRPTATRRRAGSSPSTRASPDRKNWKAIIPEAKETLDGVEPRRRPVRLQLPEGRQDRR